MNDLRGLDSWITREPYGYGQDPDEADADVERHPGVLSTILAAIDAYTAKDGATLDLSNAKGWHRNWLAMAIADALAERGHVDPET